MVCWPPTPQAARLSVLCSPLDTLIVPHLAVLVKLRLCKLGSPPGRLPECLAPPDIYNYSRFRAEIQVGKITKFSTDFLCTLLLVETRLARRQYARARAAKQERRGLRLFLLLHQVFQYCFGYEIINIVIHFVFLSFICCIYYTIKGVDCQPLIQTFFQSFGPPVLQVLPCRWRRCCVSFRQVGFPRRRSRW